MHYHLPANPRFLHKSAYALCGSAKRPEFGSAELPGERTDAEGGKFIIATAPGGGQAARR